ncbi:MAG: CRISPR-associated endonuclease Cas1 [bacterium]
MAIVYIIEQGAFINKEGQRLLVKKNGKLIHAIHIFKLKQLILYGNISLTPPVISLLLRECIDTAFMSLHGKYLGRLQPPEGKNIILRQLQYAAFQHESLIVETARAIVRGKLLNQRNVLMRIQRNRKGLNLQEEILGLKRLIDKANTAQSLDTVRGYEGKGSALYFKGFSNGFLGKDITFTTRQRRPPKDPVNAILSLGYTLLYNTLLATVYLVGLDPYLGALHAVDYGRPSLSLDLMEEWRPIIVDTLVLSVFNLKSLTAEDFNTKDKLYSDESTESKKMKNQSLESADLPVCLTETGFRKFLIQFERKMAQKVRYHLTGKEISYRDCIQEQVRHFARYIKGDDKEYVPMPYR